MTNGDDYLTLYHGSYCEVRQPLLQRCAPHKDFGCGFYLTTSESQAQAFAKISLRKALYNEIIDSSTKYGVVSVFKVGIADINKMSIHRFSTTDREWLNCVVAHRRQNSMSDIVEKYKDYDIIAGKIANDATNITITAYIAGLYGEVGSQHAVDICVRQLQPERLTNQYCFRTQRAIQSLTFLKSDKIWM